MKRFYIAFYECTPESTHRVAMATFWRTYPHDCKISPAWWGWRRMHALPFHSIYRHEKSCGVRSSWEGGYTPHISTLPLYVLCCVLLLQEVEQKAKTSRPRYSQNISTYAQSIQSAKLSFQSSKLAPPTPNPSVIVAPLPFVSRGETHSLARKGVRGTQLRLRDRHSGTVMFTVISLRA